MPATPSPDLLRVDSEAALGSDDPHDRIRAREWFRDHTRAETIFANRAGFGASLGAHALGAAFVAVLLAQPVTVPIVRNAVIAFVPPALVTPQIKTPALAQVAAQAPPPPAPLLASATEPPDLRAPSQDPLIPISRDLPFAQPAALALPPPPRNAPSGPVAGNGTTGDEAATDFDVSPALLTRANPKVPAGAEGSVRVRVLISTSGTVTQATVLDSTPYADLVLAAVYECTFRPARRRGRPVAVETTMLFNFNTRK